MTGRSKDRPGLAGQTLAFDVGRLAANHRDRHTMATRFVDAYRRYCWPVDSIDDLRIAPFRGASTWRVWEPGSVDLPDTSRHRVLRVEGLVNARDLGGLPRRDDTLTPRKVFYRSENVDRITAAGWQQVKAEGIRTVVDLRQPGERGRDTGHRPDWLTTTEVDLDGLENGEFWKDYRDSGLIGTPLYYLPHLAAMPERAGAALAAVVNAPAGGVLFHCMGGRDRTGMIALLLLSAADVQSDVIVDDYLETVRLGDVRANAEGRTNTEPEIETLCRTHGTTTEGAFRSVIRNLDFVGFLAAARLSESDVRALSTWRGSIERQHHGPRTP